MNLVELLPYLVGVVVSLVFSYVPGLKTWYEAQSGYKSLIMLGVLLVVSAIYFGLGCTNIDLGIVVSCDKEGLLAIAFAFIQIVVANQSTYLLTKRD